MCVPHTGSFGDTAPNLCKVQVLNSSEITLKVPPSQAGMVLCSLDWRLLNFPAWSTAVFLCQGVAVVAGWLVAGRGFPPWHQGRRAHLRAVTLIPITEPLLSFPEKLKLGVHLFQVSFLG